MGEIKRLDINEGWAHSGIIQAGDLYYLGYCIGNVGGSIEEQINGAFTTWNIAFLWLALHWKVLSKWIVYSEMSGISRLLIS